MFNGQIAACAATPALVIDKGALMTVTFPNQARDVNRDVARAWFELAPFARPFARLGHRSPTRSCATPSFPSDELVQGALEQQSQVTARQGMADKLPRSLDFVPEFGARRELDSVARGRERFESGPLVGVTRPGPGKLGGLVR